MSLTTESTEGGMYNKVLLGVYSKLYKSLKEMDNIVSYISFAM